MKKIALLFATLGACFTITVHAQLIAYVYPNFQTIKSKTFTRFADSYAAANSSQLRTVKPSTPGVGFTIGAGFAFEDNPILWVVEYSRAKSSASFIRNDGGERNLSLHANMLNGRWNIILGEHEANTLNGIIDLGLGIGRAVIKSSYVQGSSPVNSAALDGKYTGFHGELSGGLGLAYMLTDYIGIRANCSYHLSIFPIRLDDADKDTDYDSLPQDFASYSMSPPNYIGEEVKDDFRYFKFAVGIVLLAY
ncbi:MAG: hypothetical protein RL007_111 [Bacteroidota bacterium]|jgi:hypothetical protein